MLVHVSCLRWAEGVTAAQVGAVSDGLAALPGAVGSLRGYRFGPDAGLAPGNHDFVVVAEFDDEAGYREYAEHPAHLAVLTERIRPILAERAAVQFEAGDR